MGDVGQIRTPPAPQASAEETAIAHLRQAVEAGQQWYLALLEAMGMWASPEEEVAGNHYRYLIGNEAFDWLELAARLCAAVDGLLPRHEVDSFLLTGLPPVEVSAERMKRLLGPGKYQGYLNYLYGVVIEGCLQLAVAEEIRKEWHWQGYRRGLPLADEVCRRVYGASHLELLRGFRQERPRPHHSLQDPHERKEFTYWLFKHRVRTADKARLASDTKKGLEFWRHQHGTGSSP